MDQHDLTQKHPCTLCGLLCYCARVDSCFHVQMLLLLFSTCHFFFGLGSLLDMALRLPLKELDAMDKIIKFWLSVVGVDVALENVCCFTLILQWQHSACESVLYCCKPCTWLHVRGTCFHLPAGHKRAVLQWRPCSGLQLTGRREFWILLHDGRAACGRSMDTNTSALLIVLPVAIWRCSQPGIPLLCFRCDM